MRSMLWFIALAILIVAMPSGLVGCGQSTRAVAPPATVLTPSDDGTLPLVNGQGPPQETPPDSIVARAEKFFRGRITPMQVIAGVSSTTICNTANSWLNVPYAWGGNSRSGIDCSHLVYRVYQGAGITSYPFMTTSAMRTYSRFICVNWNETGGDIVLFGSLGHTGIYMGGGWMIDANSYYGKVRWDNLNSSYWQSFRPYPVRYVP